MIDHSDFHVFWEKKFYHNDFYEYERLWYSNLHWFKSQIAVDWFWKGHEKNWKIYKIILGNFFWSWQTKWIYFKITVRKIYIGIISWNSKKSNKFWINQYSQFFFGKALLPKKMRNHFSLFFFEQNGLLCKIRTRNNRFFIILFNSDLGKCSYFNGIGQKVRKWP